MDSSLRWKDRLFDFSSQVSDPSAGWFDKAHHKSGQALYLSVRRRILQRSCGESVRGDLEMHWREPTQWVGHPAHKSGQARHGKGRKNLRVPTSLILA